MNLYHIVRLDEFHYDEYSDAVVVAENEEEAINIHSDGNDSKWNGKWWATEQDLQYVNEPWWSGCRNWPSPNDVIATYIGIAAENLESGTVICASFHAG